MSTDRMRQQMFGRRCSDATGAAPLIVVPLPGALVAHDDCHDIGS
jgi:hypothetical protein